MKPKTTVTIRLTEPQASWLEILLESTLNAHDPAPCVQSYEAILRKLRIAVQAASQK